MLVLSRRIGEKIVTSNGITLTVLEFRNGAVKLGFEADNTIRILREEIVHAEIRRMSGVADSDDRRP